jgi:hypothetical protein
MEARGVRNPWLTEADMAEIAVVSRVLVDAVATHKEKCATCRDEGRFCTPISEAIQEACDWAERRTLTSKAQALRAAEIVARRQRFRERSTAA